MFIEFDVGFNICLISVPFVHALPIMVAIVVSNAQIEVLKKKDD